MARKVSVILLVLLCLFLLGTTIVLSTTKAYLRIDEWAYITEPELLGANTTAPSDEIVPRILHQTWKTEVLPDRWVEPSRHCRELMPDYEYMLWTDAGSRQLIADHYPWFLPTYDGYKYNIQRADAIRYFVLHRFGGVYMDLDIGCVRNIDPLLKYQVILPKTIPVGVSNDLMVSTKGHPFMEQVIRGLITFDINYVLNYPTVMFSTGPMFMSAQYGLYTASHPPTPQNPGGDIRILPKDLYGKNAKPGEAPHAFFQHFYGSSWHSDDAWLWTFLGLWGMRLMYVAVVFAVIAAIRIGWLRKKGTGAGFRGRRFMLGRYEVILPRFHYDRETGSAQFDLGPFSIVAPGHSRDGSGSSTVTSPTSSTPPSPTVAPRFPASVIPLSFEVTPASPTFSNATTSSESVSVKEALRRAGGWVFSAISRSPGSPESPRTRRDSNAGRSTPRRRRSRGILFFLPAFLTPVSRSGNSPGLEAISLPPIDSDVEAHPRSRSRVGARSRSPMRMTKDEEAQLEAIPLMGDRTPPSLAGSRRTSFCGAPPPSNAPPPPYASSRSPTPGAVWNPSTPGSTSTPESWESWTNDERQ
ncbi:hypothetical protein FRB99_008699 [Tulasnella sp. 403]|nr:hypothetical protein FRB99_008699 [Tulasnella sp. 403]